uniref:Uncharacterized protein n=1 Tax=Lygus hesperus TaxID=30085 RepID=A0A146LA32_LYGHE
MHWYLVSPGGHILSLSFDSEVNNFNVSFHIGFSETLMMAQIALEFRSCATFVALVSAQRAKVPVCFAALSASEGFYLVPTADPLVPSKIGITLKNVENLGCLVKLSQIREVHKGKNGK